MRRGRKAEALIRALVRLADTNKATQGRLAAAEQKLREIAREVAAQAPEARTDGPSRPIDDLSAPPFPALPPEGGTSLPVSARTN